MKSRKSDMAWAAGLWEGEGCFTVHTAINPTRKDGLTNVIKYPCASLSMTDKDVLEKFALVMGFGNINGPYYRKGCTKRKGRYMWCVVNKEAHKVMDALKPYLCSRRQEQIASVLAKCGKSLVSGLVKLRGRD